MSETTKCKKCRGSGERRKGEKCAVCQGSGAVTVSKDAEGRTVVTPATK